MLKIPGECRELLLPGAGVYIQRSDNPDRKTQWDLIAVEKDGQIINMDSRCQTRQWKNGSGRGICFWM